MVVSNLHNPTSAETTADDIRALADALPEGSCVLVDETFVNAGRQRDSVSRLGDPRLIAVGSLAKDPGLNALRCGWIAAFGETMSEMRLAWVHGFNIGSPVTEAAACEAVRRLPETNRRTESLLAENMRIAAEHLAPLRSEGLISWSAPERGCVIFPELRAVAAEHPFAARRAAVRQFYEHALSHAKLAVVPGDLFNPARVPDSGEASIRIGIGGPTEQLREGLGRLANLVREFSAA
jgi:aspartate/methionine/tyrosine aminotransferase